MLLSLMLLMLLQSLHQSWRAKRLLLLIAFSLSPLSVWLLDPRNDKRGELSHSPRKSN
jgi:hypothetical protein